jgi:hypothetical protein
MSTAEEFDTPQRSVLDEALAAWDAGLCVIRVHADGSKAPIGKWKHYYEECTRPDRDTVERWFKGGHEGIGVLCGATSGGLEMLEFEGRAVAEGMLDKWFEQCRDNGLERVVNKVLAGWSEESPSGGLHMLYRVEGDVPGNTKIATRPIEAKKVDTLIETRGQGGFTVIAPSTGEIHDSGRPWIRAAGGPETMATITQAERAALHALCRTFHVEADRPEPPADKPKGPRPAHSGDSWIDKVVDHVDRTRSWSSILQGYGFTFDHQAGGIQYWARPGKLAEMRGDRAAGKKKADSRAWSVTINAKGTDRLINFSTSLDHLFTSWNGTSQATSYDKLDVIAAYEYDGDRLEAAKALDPGERDQWIDRRREEDRRFLRSVPGYRQKPTNDDQDDDDEADDTVEDATPAADSTEDNGDTTDAADAPENGPGGDTEQGGNCPCLPDEFWTARPEFERIRQAAWAKGIAADGLFGAILARTAYKADWQIVLPDIIGSYQSLNLLVGLVGGSGDGKGSSLNVAERLMPGIPVSDPKAVEVTAGSGEGIPRSFYEQVPVVDEDGKTTKQREWKQIRRHVFLRIDEGEVTQAISQRRGSTFWVVMRSVYSGEGLGFNNADADRRFPVERLGYRMSAAIAIQPTIAAGLLEDKDGGTPQRFLWFGLFDANMPTNPADLPDFPGQVEWRPPRYDTNGTELVCGYNLGIIDVAPEIRSEILTAKLLHTAGVQRRNELDSHRNLTRLKVAALLGMMNQRLSVTPQDWELAETIVSTSDAVREWTYGKVDTSSLLRQLRADERQGQRQVTVNQMTAAAHATAVRVGKVIARHVHAKHADGTACKAKCLKDAVGARDRDNLGIGRDHAIVAGWIEEDHRGWLIPGDSVPTPPKGEGDK